MKKLIKMPLVLLGLVLLFLLIGSVSIFAVGTREINFGEAFPAACADCHGPEPEFALLGTRLAYNESGHNNFGNSWYANGSGCQSCHTNEGFIEYVKTGTVDSDAYIANPSQQNCFTCHDPHSTGDMSLRTTKAVSLQDGTIFNVGDGNLCASCHQARRSANDYVAPIAASSVSSHFGAHHGPQADMLMGTNAYEFEGKSYSSSIHNVVVSDGCVDCHMALTEGRYSLGPNVGGHSFNITGEIHEAEKVNLAACNQCHTDIKQVSGEEIFDKLAATDYDDDGKVEPAQAEVEGLLEALVNSEGTGLLQNLAEPFYNADGSYRSSKSDSEHSLGEMAALYNYKFILEDRSLGIHNMKYTIQILYDTIEALMPSMDTSARRPK